MNTIKNMLEHYLGCLTKQHNYSQKDVEEVENLKTRFDDIRSSIVDIIQKQLLVQTDI